MDFVLWLAKRISKRKNPTHPNMAASMYMFFSFESFSLKFSISFSFGGLVQN